MRGAMRAGVVSICALLAACADTRISGPAAPDRFTPSSSFVCAALEYTGSNPEWVPRAIRNVPGDTQRVVRFEYDIRYGLDDEDAFTLFNPLLIVGATKSLDSIYILGRLAIAGDGKPVAEYREVLTLEKSKSLFSEGETLTEIRRQGLLRLRDVMDAHLQTDRAKLRAAGFECE